MAIARNLLDTYSIEELLELCDIDQEELVEHLIQIGWIDEEALPTEVDLSAN